LIWDFEGFEERKISLMFNSGNRFDDTKKEESRQILIGFGTDAVF